MLRESEIEPLVTEVLSGRPESFVEIVNRFGRPLFNFVLNRVRDPWAAAELTQEAFERAYLQLETFQRSGRPFRLWLYRLALRVCLDWFRNGDRRPSQEPGLADSRGAQFESRQRALLALRGASKADADILLMRHADGLRDAEIASITGLDLEEVRAMLRAGIAALMKALRLEKEAESHGV